MSHQPAITEIGVQDAKTQLSRLLTMVEAGQTIVITRRGEPVARLTALEHRGAREFGWVRNRITISDDFDAPMADEDVWYEPAS